MISPENILTQDEQYVLNTLKSLVGKDKEYRADIASTLGTRVSNYLEFFSKENTVEKPLIERMLNNYVTPSREEGFDIVHFVK